MNEPTRTLPVRVDAHGETTATCYGSAGPTLVLAHGAGAGQAHPWMVGAATALAGHGLRVVTFNFLYKERGKGGPDRPPVLEATWRAVISAVTDQGLGGDGLVIGGKSMGGRIASMVLASVDQHPLAAPVSGLVLLGYPLHPPGRPDALRIAHLPTLRTPTLIVQGTRDGFGGPDEIRQHFAVVPAAVDIREVAGGDHSFAVPRATGRTSDVLATIYEAVASWVHRVTTR